MLWCLERRGSDGTGKAIKLCHWSVWELDKKISGVSQLMSRFRGWIQAGAALLTNLHLPNFIKGGLYQGTGKTVCVPGLMLLLSGSLRRLPLGHFRQWQAPHGFAFPIM